LGVLAAALIAQVLGDEIPQAQSFIQLAHEDEAAIRCDPRPLEIHLQEALNES